MDTIEHTLSTEELHPIDIVESLAETHEWDFDRVADDQIAMAIEASWRTYSLSLAWSAYEETLRMVCTFDMDPPEEKLPQLYETLNLANDKCWTGSFSLWRPQKLMVFRYGLNLAGDAQPSSAQISAMVAAAVDACERFYPAFQLVCWGDEPAEAAMQVAFDMSYGRA